MHLAHIRTRMHTYISVPMRWYAPASQLPTPADERAKLGVAICLVTGLDADDAIVILNAADRLFERLPDGIRQSVALELANPGQGLGVAEACLRRRVVRAARLA